MRCLLAPLDRDARVNSLSKRVGLGSRSPSGSSLIGFNRGANVSRPRRMRWSTRALLASCRGAQEPQRHFGQVRPPDDRWSEAEWTGPQCGHLQCPRRRDAPPARAPSRPRMPRCRPPRWRPRAARCAWPIALLLAHQRGFLPVGHLVTLCDRVRMASSIASGVSACSSTAWSTASLRYRPPASGAFEQVLVARYRWQTYSRHPARARPGSSRQLVHRTGAHVAESCAGRFCVGVLGGRPDMRPLKPRRRDLRCPAAHDW